MKKENWYCEDCEADFKWLFGYLDEENNYEVREPRDKTEFKESVLHTTFGMGPGCYYPVEREDSCTADSCDDCKDKIKEAGI